jgi:hypothetical protein
MKSADVGRAKYKEARGGRQRLPWDAGKKGEKQNPLRRAAAPAEADSAALNC